MSHLYHCRIHLRRTSRVFLFVALLFVMIMDRGYSQAFFIGGYGEGIYTSSLDAAGKIAKPRLLAEQKNPSFFGLHPKLNVLYVVTETMRNEKDHPAEVVAYRFTTSKQDDNKSTDNTITSMERLNAQKIDGDIPCHVTIDKTGRFLIIANYMNGSVVVFGIEPDGKIGAETCNIVHKIVEGKTKSNGHCSVIDATNRWVLVADLGLDRVFVYELDSKSGKLVPGTHPYLELPAGSGPRHLAFSKNQKQLFVINELNMTMSSASWNAELGKLELINTEATLPEGESKKGYSTAEVIAHRNGKFVYGSNRGHDTIVAMGIDAESGRITRLGNYSTLGKTPRNFRFSPDGKYLLAENQGSASIVVFEVDEASGALKPTGERVEVPSPACIRFLSDRP
ncbi:MAG: lactonase family protein [Pirellula sp.]|jgi:6-phosphogluconolactonase